MGVNPLPIIDVAPLWQGDGAARRVVADAIGAACRHRGFFYVTGAPGASDDVLDQARRFFALSLLDKQALAKGTGAHGYNRMGPEMGDAKEEIYFGCEGDEEPNLWPDLPGFRPVLLSHIARMHEIAERLMSAIALSLDLTDNHFADFCTEPLAALRLVRYPASGAADGQAHTAQPHTDFGALTLLLQDDLGGLEVFDAASGGWIDAPPRSQALLVNIGDLIARWTNDRYRSTLHRVRNLSGQDRYSAPFFFSGAANHLIQVLPGCWEDGQSPAYPPITVSEHLRRRFETLTLTR